MNKLTLFIAINLLMLTSCTQNSLEVDVSEIDTKPLQLLRLEEDVFSLNAQNFEQRSNEIKTKYGILYEHYLMNPFRLNGSGDSLYKKSLLDFVNDRDVKTAYKYSKALYPDSKMKELTDELNLCVKRFKVHFPKRKLPEKLVTCTTGWNYAFAYMDNAFILSLDMYLNDTAILYQMLRYPQYQTRKMNAAHILPDIARGWMLSEFDKVKPENNLLNHTIFYGKLFYAVNALLPATNDSLIIGYSTKQMKLCHQYEKQYWSYFAEKNRLYENSLMTIRELTSEGPFTGAISRDCPPRIAMWIGWQIVKSYMKHNETVTLEELMTETDAQKILTKSKYRP
ncbi:MAG: hypothetical protein PSX36_14200 [bacterium]|nr:hypothetical protein [bacterium]